MQPNYATRNLLIRKLGRRGSRRQVAWSEAGGKSIAEPKLRGRKAKNSVMLAGLKSGQASMTEKGENQADGKMMCEETNEDVQTPAGLDKSLSGMARLDRKIDNLQKAVERRMINNKNQIMNLLNRKLSNFNLEFEKTMIKVKEIGARLGAFQSEYGKLSEELSAIGECTTALLEQKNDQQRVIVAETLNQLNGLRH